MCQKCHIRIEHEYQDYLNKKQNFYGYERLSDQLDEVYVFLYQKGILERGLMFERNEITAGEWQFSWAMIQAEFSQLNKNLTKKYSS